MSFSAAKFLFANLHQRICCCRQKNLIFSLRRYYSVILLKNFVNKCHINYNLSLYKKKSFLMPLSTAIKQPFYSNSTTEQTTLIDRPPRRAVLYVPGHDNRKIQKSLSLKVDSVVLNCEDGVAEAAKSAARENVKKCLDTIDFGKSECIVRLNGVESGLIEKDVRVIFSAKNYPQTVMLPKIERPTDIEKFIRYAGKTLDDRKLSHYIQLIIFAESALGIENLFNVLEKSTELLEFSPFQLSGIVFGSDDFCADIGAHRTPNGDEISYARQKIVSCAKAFNLQAIDMVTIDYKNLDSLKKISEYGASLGYTGKQVIHPDQVPVVQEAFTPSEEKMKWAREVLNAYEEHQKASGHESSGAITYKGQMIDQPVLKQAHNIVSIANYIQQGVNVSETKTDVTK